MHARLFARPSFAGAVALAAVWTVLAPAAPLAKAQGIRNTIPRQEYYAGVDQLYRGEYRDAARTFNRALSGAVKTLGPNGQIRWIDSICYHAMLGETFYHAGQPAQALAQFNFACALFLQYPRWMMRVQFDAQPTAQPGLLRNAVPWGASQRGGTPANVPETFGVAQGSLVTAQQIQQGGAITLPELWPVNVLEVVRCTALAIRRRNEILGPLGPFDPISKNLAMTLDRGGAPPNHWSNAWVELQRGFAHAGIGDTAQAAQFLSNATLLAGTFDYPLTGLALCEQGRLALDAGDTAAAANFLAEATYSGYIYEDAGVIDEAFRWLALNHIASDAGGVHPALPLAAAWARRKRLDHVGARLSLSIADQLMISGDWQNATAALAAGESQLSDARNGLLGNRALFLEAKLDYHAGRESAAAKLNNALQGQMAVSLVNFQIGLANSMFDAQTLPLRTAPEVYELLLSDPTPADAILRLQESMAVMQTPHDDAFQRWLLSALDRGNMGAAIEITDRAKRRRFHNAMPWGGRLAALRTLLTAPVALLGAQEQQHRNDLLAKFGDFAQALSAAEEDRTELLKLWQREMDDDTRRKTTSLWKDYAGALHDCDIQLGDIGLSPVPAELSFPPLIVAADIQAKLQPGQALLVYHDTADGLLGFLFTSKSASQWNCGPSVPLGGLVSKFLRDLGNIDGNREMTVEQLNADDWKASGEKLAQSLLEGSSLAPADVTELIVIPDGVVWYVPFEALVANIDGKKEPLLSVTKVRYAPTVGLAFRFDGEWRRVQRTGLVLGEMVPGDKPEQRAEAAAALTAAVPNPLPLQIPAAAPSPILASLLDALVVLADVDANGPDPFAWSPLPIDRVAQVGSLDQWLAVPGNGPQRVLLPGMHTLAERGGKAPRRAGAAPPGSELFYASCSLMSAGAETMLLSRWRMGGQSTLDLVREFVQELPATAAAEAWQRSVQLAMEMPIDPASELRVKSGPGEEDLTGKHPFFWAGYLVVDSGWHPNEDTPSGHMPAEPAVVPLPAAAPAGAPPANPTPPDATPAQPVPANPTPPQTTPATPATPSPATQP